MPTKSEWQHLEEELESALHDHACGQTSSEENRHRIDDILSGSGIEHSQIIEHFCHADVAHQEYNKPVTRTINETEKDNKNGKEDQRIKGR